jgi:tetratricopeptide (TPR) repeat protein
VENKLKTMPDEQSCAYCTYGDYVFPAELSKLVSDTANLVNSGKTKEAATLLKQAIENHPELVDLQNLRAEVILQTGGIREARQILANILKRWPGNWQALNNLAVLEMHDRKYRSALDLFRQILAVDPNNRTVLENLRSLRERITLASMAAETQA